MRMYPSRRQVFVLLAFLFFLAVPVAAASALIFSYQSGGAILPGVYIAGADVGRLHTDDAIRALEQRLVARPSLFIREGGREIRVDIAQLGVTHDAMASVRQAAAVGRQGTFWQRVKQVGQTAVQGYELPAIWRVDEARFSQALEHIAAQLEREPRSARMVVSDDGTVRVIPHETGLRIDRARLAAQILRALEEGRQVVHAPVAERTRPAVTAEDLQVWQIDTLLARFQTRFDPKHSARAHNIALAASALDGVVLKPGEVLSFNQVVGPRSINRGYQPAPVIIDGEFIDDVGGGICQVSTTLYNAALLSGLTIVERRPHSVPVSYVPLGRDATVVYGAIDLRLQNPYRHPLLIQTRVEGDLLQVDVFGPRQYYREWRLYSIVEEVPASGSPETGSTVAKDPGSISGRKGYRVEVWRAGLNENGVMVRERVNRSYYPPRPATP